MEGTNPGKGVQVAGVAVVSRKDPAEGRSARPVRGHLMPDGVLGLLTLSAVNVVGRRSGGGSSPWQPGCEQWVSSSWSPRVAWGQPEHAGLG